MIRELVLGVTAALAAALPQQGGEVEVSAALNRQTAEVGETVTLTVTLRAPGLRVWSIEDPSFESLELISSSDRNTFRFSSSLGAVRELAREYTLRALEPGGVTIPPVRITVEGVTYETDALRLVVERMGSATEIPRSMGPRPEEEVAVRLWVEPETVYVGQQVTMTVGAFFDPLIRSRLQRQPEYRPPELQGFWIADLPGSSRPERRVVGGREYFVQIYRRALFALSPGGQRIPPASVIYEVRRGLIYAPETFQVESAPVTVFVKPLPREGAPADFAGAVGRYETEIWFDRSQLRAGEAVHLWLDVQGSGNLSSLARPEMPEIAGVRVYEGGEEAEVQLRGTEFAGHKRFSWVLVPERPGQFVLPALRIPYFDPWEARYSVARTEPVTLTVDRPAAAGVVPATGGSALRFVKAEPGRQPLDLARRTGFWLVQLLALGVLLASFAFGRYRLRTPALRRPRAQRRQQVLRDLRPLASSGDAAFFGQLRAALLSWLQSRLHQPGLAGRGMVQLQHGLEDAGVPPDVALEVIGLLERCGRLRYAPDPPGASVALDSLAEAERLMTLVDREAVSEKRLRATLMQTGGGALAIAALLVLPGIGVGQTNASDGERWFDQGVEAYGRGAYTEAAQLFELARSARPRDPNVLFNLGNAYYELGRKGEAVALWIRSLRLRPRDDDVRYNLRLAVGDDPVVGSALNPLPLSPDELALIFSALWIGGCAALIARRRWRKGWLTFAGGTALLLGLAAAALMLYPRAEYAIVAADDAALRAGPVRQSEILASPPLGSAYRVIEQRGGWLRVSRGVESEGWINAAQVQLIDG
ncbi:MAG: tetratricopeptide repeat protein [Gemmatimonadetes bacterium]|uniref:Tetratricopeptide repeat protein n=1 Tax=Candidatus Kutchimonas denitrificans TaxID=3056748 RepID=A0AAE4ZD78_9BACT|nr:tetratricopeptide repeat protein [Gemmatimonadota bacterium]NIR76015.1 tetratricopeptide repeat protein [Candidatus Kutchimonas denitrificans]NIS02207.1 tetratricopeptide repeat protein [Gemmatimonadota bacterium]NIT68033.1 tetratricopeptide repeat protein [Gemmatimonadota bacterium]NIU54059.1 tetratricopeptide repeat protein [Gemmatimonadota bacterium]